MLTELQRPSEQLRRVTAKVRGCPGRHPNLVIDFRLGQPRLASLIPIESNKEGFK